MREPENCKLIYCGFEKPRTTDEVDFEILGLKALISKAKEKISTLEQSRFLANIAIKNECTDLKDAFSGE